MKKVWIMAVALAAISPVNAEGIEAASMIEADTLRVIDVEEVSVVASPKENKKLRQLPAAVTLLSKQQMQAAQVTGLKSLTTVVPNLFIPNYGSQLTSAVYIRGIGSRINTPSVGLYVDNIPYVNQSAFDFSYTDVERIDVLRGPQATLYGRNAMGGLIKVHTKSPFSYQGTDLRLGAATDHAYNGSLTHYHRVNDRFAFSTGGFYNYTDGFYKNTVNGNRMGQIQQAGGRFRGIFLSAENWKADLNLSYEYSDQNGYPYFYMGQVANESSKPDELGQYIGTISHNEASSYYRNLFNVGLNLEHQAENFTFSAVTGYQFLKDRMFLDQDFSPMDIFNIEQRQKMSTLSEEIILKSKNGRRWQWTTGVFGFYQWMNTDGPVNFHRSGIDRLIQDNIQNVFDGLAARPGAPQMTLTINNDNINIGGKFETPTYSGAVFHQSTFNDLLIDGLSATVGLRLDYERVQMKYHSAASPANFDFSLKMQQMPMPLVSKGLLGNARFEGKESTDYVQLLPKFALQYEWKNTGNIYATVSRGYRSGGYNIQMFNDLMQSGLKNGMMDAIAADAKFNSMGAMIDKMKDEIPAVSDATIYKPEYTWNYEVGAHLNLFDSRLNMDAAVFLMDTHDQQISKFADSGLGRVTVNAGRSRSMGAEAQLNAALCEVFTLNAGYGYTYATFRDYVTNVKVNGELTEVSYKGNYVPFVPKHTMNVGGEFLFKMKKGCWLDAIRFNANYAAAGRIYWTEQNTVGQAFYGTLNGHLSLQKGQGEINLWVRNALDKDYASFYFESMGNKFMQKGNPVQAGLELRCRF